MARCEWKGCRPCRTLAASGFLQHYALGFASKDDVAAQSPSVFAYVDDVVGLAHDFLVVLYDDNGVAQLLQLAQHVDESLCVARVQAYAWFVEYVHATHQTRAQTRGQVDALALSSR